MRPSPNPDELNNPAGLVLAAGLGTRMRPITERIPKPLIPFFGVSPLDLALDRLLHAGIRPLAYNTHHLGDEVAKSLESKSRFPVLQRSHESTILGTGGAVAGLRAWLQGRGLIIYNADVVSDIDLSLLKTKVAAVGEKPVACMVLLDRHLGTDTPVWVKDNSQVVGIGHDFAEQHHSNISAHTFTGVHWISNEFVILMPAGGVFSIIDQGYKVALQQGLTISAQIHKGTWFDLGTPKAYIDAHRQVLSKDCRTALNRLGVLDALRATGKQPLIVEANASVSIGECVVIGPAFFSDEPTGSGRFGPNLVIQGSFSLNGPVELMGAERPSVGNCVALDQAKLQHSTSANSLGDRICWQGSPDIVVS